jgi:hypothetical protein
MIDQIALPPAPDPDPYRDPVTLALIAEVFEHGTEAGIEGMLTRHGLEEATFRARYDTFQDCAVDCYERFTAAFKRRIGGAFNAGSQWRDSLRCAAYETADLLEESPELAYFGTTGVLQVNSELARVRREEVFVFCAELIDLGRTEPSGIKIDESASVFAIGSIMQLLTFRIQTGAPIEPHATVPEMMYAAVRAYKGEEVAREELELPDPRPSLGARGPG